MLKDLSNRQDTTVRVASNGSTPVRNGKNAKKNPWRLSRAW
jgi:hypothetical protein